MSAKRLSMSPNRTWPTAEPRGWQHTEEFFAQYPTPRARRDFYEKRRIMNNQIQAGMRKPDGTFRGIPLPLHSPRPFRTVADQVVEITATTL